jgi:hypothetical protein
MKNNKKKPIMTLLRRKPIFMLSLKIKGIVALKEDF